MLKSNRQFCFRFGYANGGYSPERVRLVTGHPVGTDEPSHRQCYKSKTWQFIYAIPLGRNKWAE
jgi:hypothetical protein